MYSNRKWQEIDIKWNSYRASRTNNVWGANKQGRELFTHSHISSDILTNTTQEYFSIINVWNKNTFSVFILEIQTTSADPQLMWCQSLAHKAARHYLSIITSNVCFRDRNLTGSDIMELSHLTIMSVTLSDQMSHLEGEIWKIKVWSETGLQDVFKEEDVWMKLNFKKKIIIVALFQIGFTLITWKHQKVYSTIGHVC